jgi:predicted DNA-binding protein YlxM (UPF0122 family)
MNFHIARLTEISVHYVGNKSTDQRLTLSKETLELEDDLMSEIKNFFLNRFTSVFEKNKFVHPTSLQYNEVYQFASGIFSGENSFHLTSVQLAKHLYENSVHPKVKGGEFYVCSFTDCIFENETVEALGIFKTENKTNYLDIKEDKSRFSLSLKQGIDLNKLDKGCLIFNTHKDEGYHVLMIDSQSKGDEAQYWRENFLGLAPVSDEFHQTNQFLHLAKNFVTKQIAQEFEVSKTDQIDLLNRSVAYFKKNDSFDKTHFEKEVFQDPGLIKSFREYDQSYRQDHEMELTDQFDISQQAVKQQARVFKSVLKLDKNFHIYIHGSKELIEQGIDPDGRKYYKIYYKEES